MITANIDDYAKHLMSPQTVALFLGRAAIEKNKIMNIAPVATVALQSAFLPEVVAKLENAMLIGSERYVGHIISEFAGIGITHVVFEKVLELFSAGMTGLSNEDVKIVAAETIAVLIQQNIMK